MELYFRELNNFDVILETYEIYKHCMYMPTKEKYKKKIITFVKNNDIRIYACLYHESKTLATLNFRENPRWGIAEPKNTIEVNQRFDWILLKNPYPAKYPEIKNCMLFGTKISGETNLAASDHYGIMIEIEF